MLTIWLVYKTRYFKRSGHAIAHNSSKSLISNFMNSVIALLYRPTKIIHVPQKQKSQGCQIAC